MAGYRRKLSMRRSKRMFSRNAGVHIKNLKPRPQRGGIRL